MDAYLKYNRVIYEMLARVSLRSPFYFYVHKLYHLFSMHTSIQFHNWQAHGVFDYASPLPRSEASSRLAKFINLDTRSVQISRTFLSLTKYIKKH